MARISHLLRRGGAYSVRMRVPADLVDILGRKEIVRALGTSEEVEARRRLFPVLAKMQAEFDDLRAHRILTKDDRDHAVWDHYTGALDRDDAERAQLPTEAEIAAAKSGVFKSTREGADLSQPLAVLDVSVEAIAMQNAANMSAERRRIKLEHLRKHVATNETALIADEVDAYVATHRLIAPRDSAGWITLARAMMRAEIEALRRSLERDAGDYGGQPGDPIVKPATGPRRETAAPGERISDVFEIFASENPRGVAKDRVDQCRRDIGTFVEMVGATFPLKNITKAEVRDWKQLLTKLPVKATETKAFAKMDIRQIVKANEKIGKPVLADRTVNRYLSSLGAFLTWSVNNGYIDRNPVEGLMLKKEAKAPTLPFNADQLQTLFSSPWFAGCQSADEWRLIGKPGNVLIRDHRFWVPLIMLFSGARPGEIGQLAVGDVRQMHGQWIMHITSEGDGHGEGKSVKTAGSMRVVPVHPELIRLGFIRYHEARVKAGGTQLFPGAVRNTRGQMMADMSREFARHLTRIGLKNGRGLSLYSFRHGAADALRRAGYLDQQFGFILGHTQASMTGRYGIMPQGMLAQRVELIDAIAYPGLNLDHLVTL